MKEGPVFVQEDDDVNLSRKRTCSRDGPRFTNLKMVGGFEFKTEKTL